MKRSHSSFVRPNYRALKIGIYDPYLDTLGGGEKYIFGIAECFLPRNSVTIFWNDDQIVNMAQTKFQIDLNSLKISPNIFENKTNFIDKYKTTFQFDLFFFLSDGSIPFLFSKRNILIFQFPVNWVRGNTLFTQLKLKNIHHVICYSQFVKLFVDQTFHVNSKVLPPAVKPISSQHIKKENIILTVGRFTKGMNRKKQEVLMDVFKELYNKGLKDWKLVLIGSNLANDQDFVSDIQNAIKNYPIKVLVNIPHKNLIEYYQRAKIYWHAAGFGEDLGEHPERAEHFGITTVEAMSAGVVPVVINAGGQKEIVEDGKNGYLWDNLSELKNKTLKLINNEEVLKKLSIEAEKRAEFFSENRFCKEITNLIE